MPKKVTNKQLDLLPNRTSNETAYYDSIIIRTSKIKYDGDYNGMIWYGCNNNIPEVHIGSGDALHFDDQYFSFEVLRNQHLQVWSAYGKLKVSGRVGSSLKLTVADREEIKKYNAGKVNVNA
jgi:hypothetical protein